MNESEICSYELCIEHSYNGPTYRYVVLIVFTTEHALLLVALLLEWLISSVPKKVYIGIAKQEYWANKNEHND